MILNRGFIGQMAAKSALVTSTPFKTPKWGSSNKKIFPSSTKEMVSLPIMAGFLIYVQKRKTLSITERGFVSLRLVCRHVLLTSSPTQPISAYVPEAHGLSNQSQHRAYRLRHRVSEVCR
jgi:hypothetical protein